MLYEIKQSKLIKLLSPFENLIFKGQEKPITKELIKKYLNKGDVFVTSEDNEETKMIKQIAFEIMNPSQDYLTLNIDKISEEYLSHFIEEIEVFYQLCYKRTDQLMIDIKGDVKTIKALFGDLTPLTEEKSQHLYHTKLEPYQNKEQFDFIIHEYETEDRWEDKTYILDKVEIDYSYLTKINPKLWEDKEFVVNLLNKVDYKSVGAYLSEEIIYSTTFMSGVMESYLLTPLWVHHYEQYYNLEKKDKKRNKIEKEHQLSLKVINHFNQELFSQPGKEDVYDNEIVRFIQYIPQEIRKTSGMMMLLTKYLPKHPKLKEYFPKEYFDDIQNVIHYLSSVEVKSYIAINDAQEKKPYMSWINDKEKVLRVMKEVGLNLRNELSHFAIPFLNDKSFYDAIKIIWVDSYIYLPEDTIHTKEDIKRFIMWGETSNVKQTSFEHLYAIMNEDKELLKIWFYEHAQMVMSQDKHNPWIQKWFSDEELIAELGINIDIALQEGLISKSTMKRLMENNTLIEKVLNSHSEFYLKLPVEKQLEHDFAYAFLMKYKDSAKLESLSNFIWLNKGFCLTALTVSSNYIEHIPPQMFHNKDFLYQFFEGVDNNEISTNVLNRVPHDLKLLLEEFNITENYTEFLISFEMNNKLQKELVATQPKARNKI